MTFRSFILTIVLGMVTLPILGQSGVDTNTVSYSLPQEYEIGEIEVLGLVNMKSEYVIRRSGLIKGSRITIPGEDIANAVKGIWRDHRFSNVQIYMLKEKSLNNLAWLQIIVEEKPTVANFTITGLTKKEEEDIRDKIQLSPRDPLTESEKSRISNVITSHFTEKGFLNTDVIYRERIDSSKKNSVFLTIEVDKAKRIKIDKIIVYGNENVHPRVIKGTLKDTKERSKISINPSTLFKSENTEQKTGFLRALGELSFQNVANYMSDKVRIRIFNTSKYIKENFEGDKQFVVQYYNSLGYRDARIVSDSFYQIDETNIRVVLTVDEGPKYYFRNISWEGNAKYPSELLDRILNINKGDVYDRSYLEQKLFMDINGGDVSSLYMDDGYLMFNLNPQEQRVEGDSIDIVVKIYEGPQAIINKVTIKGNTKTSEHVIRRELRTMPGGKFSRADLIRSQREIAALGYFDPEQIGILPTPRPEDGTVDIEYTVVEKPSDQIELSAGWGGTVGGLYGSAGIVFNNFSLRKIFEPGAWKPLPAGDGQQLSFRVQSRGRFLQSYTFSFTEPWLGGKKPNAFTVSLNYSSWNQTGLPKDDPLASFIVTRGITMVYGKRLKWPDDYFTLSSSINYQNYFLKNYEGFVIRNGNSNNLFIRETLSRIAAQGNQFFPHGGSNFSLSLQLTPPYSWFDKDRPSEPDQIKYKFIEYHKWRFNAEWFTKLAGSSEMGKRKLVLRASAKLGFLGYYTKEMGISPFERFRVGGDGLSGGFTLYGFDIISLRGTQGTIVPVGSPGITTEDLNAPIFNKFSLELRYPFSLSASSTMYGMLFLEGGNSYASFQHYDPFDLQRAVGVGIRVFLPMFGLLGFDYGIGFDTPEVQAAGTFWEKLGKGAFHFKLGFEPE